MPNDAIALTDAFAKVHDHWSPKIIAAVNGQHVKLAKIQGVFVWHAHPDTDELFWVHKGQLRIEYRDRHVDLTAGDMHVVPKGTEHRPVAEPECEILMIETAGTTNTGDAPPAASTTEGEWLQ